MRICPVNAIAATADDAGQARFIVHPDRGCAVLEASGEVDIATTSQMSEALCWALDYSPRIVIDLTKVTFMDSSGLNVLAAGWRRARAHGGDIGLVSPADDVRGVLQVTGLDRLFTISHSVADAITAVAH
jgi:anti-sigma B factor antagonist